MLSLTLGRSRAAVLAVGGIVGAVLGALYAGQDYFPAAYQYPLADAVSASTSIVVLGAVVCLLAAYQMSVIIDVWGRLDIRRPAIVVVAQLVVPVIIIGLMMMAVQYILFVGRGLTQPRPLVAIALVSIMSLVAWSLVGAALGAWLRPSLAYPLSFIGPLFFVAFPVSWEPVWIRHLTGAYFDCCTSNFVLDNRAISGSLLMMAALGGVAICALLVRLGPLKPRLLVVAAALAATVLLGISATTAVNEMGPFPTAERSPTDVTCDGGVCVRPEATATLAANQVAWSSVSSAWRALGLPLDESFEIGPTNGPGRLGIVVLSESEAITTKSMAGLLPQLLRQCEDASGPVGQAVELDPSTYQLSWLLGRQLGLPESDLSDLVFPADEPALDTATILWDQALSCGPP